jgi:hypothetical protein
VTVTWVGDVTCNGETEFPEGVAQLALGDWHGYPTSEPFTTPSAVVSNWAEMPLLITPATTLSTDLGTSKLGSPFVVALIPADLPSGDYVVFTTTDFLIASGPITVNS